MLDLEVAVHAIHLMFCHVHLVHEVGVLILSQSWGIVVTGKTPLLRNVSA